MKSIRILTLITALLCAAALWAMSGVSSAANLIVNADFSAGATSFSSAYTNKTAVVGNQALYDTGTYAITSNPNLKHDQAASYFDHTSGNASGAMMAANGSGVAGTVVWEQVVTVTPATLYDFSAWLSSWISANPATMNFTVNGSTIGSLAANGGTQWVEFVSTWNSGASTTATIRIVNTNTAGGGNDFALDDLYFGIQLPRLTSVAPNTGLTAGGTAVTLTGTGFTGATNVTFGGTAATNRVVVNATTITCTTPARAAGTASVVVTTPAGTNAANTLYTYVIPAVFGAATNFPAGTNPIAVAVDDFNGDGRSDLAVANWGSSNVSIRLGTGTGSFGAATNFAVGTNPSSVSVGDFNGDGKPDLAVANFTSNNVSILRGTGAGSFGPATNFPVGTTAAWLAVGDLNGDGKPDLAVTNASSNNVSILLGNGAGSFGAATNFPVGTRPRSVAVGDFNGDGKPDLAVANHDSNNVSILLNLTVPATTVTAISPTSGSTAGGTAVTITGTGFTGATKVTFGGTAATILTVTATSITCTTPVRAAGTAGVAVTTPAGTNAANTLFTYVGPLSSSNLTTAAYTGTDPTPNQGVLYNFPIVSDSQAAPATLTITSTSAGAIISGNNAVSGNNINTGFRTNVNLTLNPGESVVEQTISLTTGYFDDGLRLDYNGLKVLDFDFSNYNVPAVISMFGFAGWTPWSNEGSPALEMDAGGLRLMVTATSNGTGTAAGVLAGQRVNLLDYFTADAYVRYPVNPDFVSGVQIGLYNRNQDTFWSISNATMTATARVIKNTPTGLASLATGTGQQINTTWFRDAQNGFVGTDGGGVRVTNNGGQTWTLSTTGVTDNIYAIRQVDGVAFLAGANGLICRSTNNGGTWTAQATNTTATFRGLAFSSATRGFAVGTGGTICIYNGTTWLAQNSGTTADFTGVSVVGNTAWAVGAGGVICFYNGTSWVPVNSGVTRIFYGVSFLRENLGFAVGANGLLCRYNGTAWQEVLTGVTITWRSVFVADENTIVISGDGGMICQSTDGGQTWLTLSAGSSAVLTTVGVAGGQGCVFGSGGVGFTFTVRLPTGLVSLSTGTERQINTTWFSDAQNGFMGTDGGGVRVTNNGGETWTTSNTGVTHNIFAIRKVGTVAFLAGANGLICRSTDNGATWTAQTTLTTETFRALAFSSTTRGFAVGTGGTICIYNGTTWLAQNSGTTVDLTGVSTVGNTAWAVGAGGVICYYNGTSWATVNSGVTADFTSVSFVSANLGYAVGAGGLICRYNGTTWVQVNSGVTAILRSVVVVNESTIVISGDSGLICQSIDGGVTWQTLTVGSSEILTALAVVEGQVVVAGQGGAGYAFSVSPPPAPAAEGVITTVAGTGTAGSAGDQGQATSAQLNKPFGTVTDLAGNLYIADEFNHRIRKVTPSGVISTIAGDGTAAFGGDGGAATAAKLNRPTGVAFDASGNLYIADRFNNRIRKVNTSGVISTVAGTTTGGSSGDGGQATAAQLNAPTDVAFDPWGELYIADGNNHKIRKVNASGIISTVAGTTVGFSGDGGQATAARLNYPLCIDFDASGNLFISDNTNHRIRKVNASGVITTVVGTTQGFLGDGGLATAARLNFPLGITIDGADNIFFADANNHRIRKVDTSGVITTVAGNGTAGFSGDGGPATSAQLNTVFDVALDAAGNFYIADTNNNRIRKVWGLGEPSDQPTALTTLNTGTTKRINTTWFRDAMNGFIGTDGGGVRVTSDGGQTWTDSITGVSNNIYAIRQVGSVVFLAGANGLICRSTNNGASWTEQTTNTSATFRALAFSSTTRGFAVGTGGTICIYNGTTWVAQTSGTTADLTGVSTVGNTAWAVGAGGVICYYNGTSWATVNSGVTRDIYGVSFLRDNLGFAVGAGGLVSRYNGAVWETVDTGFTDDVCRSVFFADDSTIVISGDNGLVRQSTDGGENWWKLSVGSSVECPTVVVAEGQVRVFGSGGAGFAFSVSPPTGLAGLATETDERINGAWFSNAQNGFIATDNGGVQLTSDGGQTWTDSTTGVGNDIFAIRQVGVGGVAFLAGANGLICRSTNNGATWTTQTTNTTAIFRGLAFSSATSGFAVGTGGTICIYNGTTWVKQTTGTPADFTGVSIVGTTAWAVGSGGIICRYNGTSWAPVNSGTTRNFYGVAFLRENLGFAVGAGGLLCRYNGTSWVAVNTGITTAFRSVVIADENTIVISGDGGLICQSTDGGVTWQTLTVGSSEVLTTMAVVEGQVRVFGAGGAGFTFSVRPPTGLDELATGTEERINGAWFSNAQNGFIATGNGGVRVTTNGGQTWTDSTTGVSNDIFAIRQVGVGGVAFLAGANGLICRSINNGITWTEQATGTTATFRALAFSSATSGFAVGTGGTICIYNGTTWVAQNTGTTKEFTGVSIVGTTAWAVGAGGIICRYNGTSWVQVNSGVTANFYGVAFLRENLGFAVGAGGLLCRYNGTSWVAVNTGVTTAFRSVVIVDENTIVISGDGGLICQSTDGGVTWQTLSVGSSVSLTSLALAGSEVLAFGDGGTGFAFSVSLLPLTPFRITAFSYNPTARTVNLTFLSEPAVNYTLETSPNGQTWTVLGAPVPGAAGATSTTVTNRPLQPPYTDRLMLRMRRP